MIILPTEKTEPKVKNPRFMIMYGRPKAGKTSCVAALDDNLIIDLEGGSEFLSCLAVQARSVKDIADIANAIREKMVKSHIKELLLIMLLDWRKYVYLMQLNYIKHNLKERVGKELT